ncbi:MAG: hypothetical protein JWP18_493, partial [Solirubrobacterales bacterium]|nr:hypothetical protein [Solirubrobacterales bacterium]
TRSPEVEAQNEVDDLEQMLEAANRHRRRRGAPELTEASMRATVAQEVRASHSHSDKYTADQEIDQMLALKNRRRKAKGLSPISIEDYKRELGADG